MRFIKQRRLQDLGEASVDPELIARMIWEGDHGADGPGLARIMNELSSRHPVKAKAASSLPRMPLIPDLVQAINLGAVDSRGVVALIQSQESAGALETYLTQLLFEEGIAGRVHATRVTSEAWREAQERGLVGESGLRDGVVFLTPEVYGRTAEVGFELPLTARLPELRAADGPRSPTSRRPGASLRVRIRSAWVSNSGSAGTSGIRSPAR